MSLRKDRRYIKATFWRGDWRPHRAWHLEMTVFFAENFGPTAFIVSRKIPQKRMLGWNSILERLTLFTPVLVSWEKKASCLFQYFCPLALCFFSRFGFGIFKNHTTKNHTYTHLKLNMWNLENGGGFCFLCSFDIFIFIFSFSLPLFFFSFLFFCVFF